MIGLTYKLAICTLSLFLFAQDSPSYSKLFIDTQHAAMKAFAPQKCPGYKYYDFESQKCLFRKNNNIDGDSTLLKKLLKKHDCHPGIDFKALVIDIRKNDTHGFDYIFYDFNETANIRKDWWPASTVKLFAAIAALEKIEKLGFSANAKITFAYDSLPHEETTIKTLVNKAITPSNNLAFDQLVEFVGHDELNKRFLSASNGLKDTVLLRAYSGRFWYPDLHKGCNLYSPKIVINQGSRVHTLKKRTGKGTYDCPNYGNCTSLKELSEAMKRVMMHETLRPHQRFSLSAKNLKILREALRGKRKRGSGVEDGIKSVYPIGLLDIYHKPGYAARWFSDVLFIYDPLKQKRWIVAMANKPGRDCLDDAAKAMGIILKNDELHRFLKGRKQIH